MRRFIVIVLMLVILCGCTGEEEGLSGALMLRSRLQAQNQFRFIANITADYGDRLHTFSMEFSSSAEGKLTFCVLDPEPIAGITGYIDDTQGALTFDKEVLTFGILTDAHVNPVGAPWLMIKLLRSGYISAYARQKGVYEYTIDDTYQSYPVRLMVTMDDKNLPDFAQIVFDGRRILTIDVEKFEFL